MLKKCCICKKEKNVKHFKSHKTRKDGLQSQCIECHKEYRRRHYLLNKDKYIKKAKDWRQKEIIKIRDIKSKIGCAFCAEKEPVCLEFHHLDKNTKMFNISRAVGTLSQSSIQEEIDKCIVLCSNCHKKLHAGLLKL